MPTAAERLIAVPHADAVPSDPVGDPPRAAAPLADEPDTARGSLTLRVEEMWLKVKRRIASQRLARDGTGGQEPPCEHDWTMLEERDTWSGPARISTCSRCPAVLREWGTGPHTPQA